jgi:hypothetical protein
MPVRPVDQPCDRAVSVMSVSSPARVAHIADSARGRVRAAYFTDGVDRLVRRSIEWLAGKPETEQSTSSRAGPLKNRQPDRLRR